ncbi:probable Golgi SNAP receptor complex member 2 [Coccomyxa sp. Obi]|nr:probable Golgi SNAP receptor complex member 2 [Coccomyxa sp. Obi]
MSDLQSLHKSARTLILSLREGVERLEKGDQVHQHYGQATGLSEQLEGKLGELQRISQQMDSIWRMQVLRESNTKRDIWKLKVEQVSEETDALQTALEKHTHKERRRRIEEAERAQLLSRSDPNSNGGWRATMDDDAQAMGYVQNSKRALEEAFQTGTAILTNMAGQRERLKSAQRKMLDLLNSVGLSDSLLRVIERRQRMDKWITYGGMFLVTCLLIGFWWWYRS